MHKLKKAEFDYIICDSPAGIEKGAKMALYFADEAVVTTNPEVSSVRDSPSVLESSNAGKPVILDEESEAGQAYTDAIDRLLGEAKPHRFMEVQKKGILKRIFG